MAQAVQAVEHEVYRRRATGDLEARQRPVGVVLRGLPLADAAEPRAGERGESPPAEGCSPGKVTAERLGNEWGLFPR